MADVLAVRDAYRAQQWEMVVQECAASGLSNREFCRQRLLEQEVIHADELCVASHNSSYEKQHIMRSKCA